MSSPLLIGLHGGSGVGKSAARRHLAARGVLTLDADAVYHDLLASDSDLRERLRTAFPEAFADGILDRRTLGRIVFHNPARRDELNAITHPRIWGVLNERARAAEVPVVVIEGMDLTPYADAFAALIAVAAPRALRIQRIIDRDGLTKDEAAARVNAQPDDRYYQNAAPYTVSSAEGLDALTRAIDEVYNQVTADMP